MPKKPKILVVDDEMGIVGTLKQFLSVKGYEVNGALSGKEALTILEKDTADIVLLDMMMPGMKGREVANIIRDKYPSVKIIVITGFPEEGKNLSKDNLADAVFVKPLLLKELYYKLSEALDYRQERLLDVSSCKGIKARLLLINAKLLFVEPSLEVYNFLNSHFKELSFRGENYEIAAAAGEKEVEEKLRQFNPDLLIFNMNYLNSLGKDFMEDIINSAYKPKEIIIYNLNDAKVFSRVELEKLARTVRAFCLKNGLIEIKWVEI